MYILTVTYTPEELPDYEFDVSLDDLVGIEHKSCNFKNGIRQICWRFESEKQAKSASRKLKKFDSPLKLKVEVCEEE
jgi:hypothetical protein